MKYHAVVAPTSTGYCGRITDLRGLDLEALIAVGSTTSEVRGLLRDCITERIAELHAEGRTFHPPDVVTDVIDVEWSEAVTS
jgi:hypothetical protein